MLKLAETLARLRKLPRQLSENTAWIVLTGAPSTGKSTVLESLADRGYSTHREQAREFLEQQIARGLAMPQLTTDPKMLVQRIFERNLQTHRNTSRQGVAIFDRGLPDVLAFGLIDHVDIEPYIPQCGEFRFVTAFLFERVPTHLDRLVYHSQTQLDEIERACEGIYTALGAVVHRLPAFSSDVNTSAARRMALIEQEVRRLTGASA